MKKIVRKDGKIYEVWSNDASFRHTTWKEIGTYEEEETTESPSVEETVEKTYIAKKKRRKSSPNANI